MNHHHSFHTKRSKDLNIAHVGNMFRSSFSETEIMAVNDLLLSNGFHTLTVKNIGIGRHILETFLTLLNYYQQVYWLTIDGNPPFNTTNLYESLQAHGCIKVSGVEAYEAYLCEAFYADFLVIEYTEQLLREAWYADFEQALYETCTFDQIPVVQLLYADYQ